MVGQLLVASRVDKFLAVFFFCSRASRGDAFANAAKRVISSIRPFIFNLVLTKIKAVRIEVEELVGIIVSEELVGIIVVST